ncbi:MAG: hypothetical protein WAZ34_10580 [Rhodocyclaceae bacterium]
MVKPTTRANHLITLRENRSRRFDSNLKPALEARGIDSGQFRQRFFQDMALMQNRTRGSLFELAGEVLLTGHLQQMGHAGAELRKQVRFAAGDKLRIADFFAPAIKTIFEVKSGYVVWSKPVRLQAAKDAWLLKQSPEVAQVVWLLFRGGSARALAGLEAADIECFDLGFGGEAPVSKPTTVIRV